MQTVILSVREMQNAAASNVSSLSLYGEDKRRPASSNLPVKQLLTETLFSHQSSFVGLLSSNRRLWTLLKAVLLVPSVDIILKLSVLNISMLDSRLSHL